MKEDVRLIKEFIENDAKLLRGKGLRNGHVVLNWLQIGLLVGSMIVSAAGSTALMWWRMGSMDRTLHEVKGAQEADSRSVADLKNQVSNLKERATEDRGKIKTLQDQMVYRIQFEATARAIHPETEW